MTQKSRELLVTTKVAQNWQEDFDQKVDELILIVSKVDNQKELEHASEMLDVYNKKRGSKKSKAKRTLTASRPFAFLVFRN